MDGMMLAAPVGLTEVEAGERLARDGRNELLIAPPLRWRTAVLRQLTDVMILVLLGAAVLTAAVGDVPDTAVIVLVVLINSALGAVQEMRAGRAVDALADLTAPQATVIRDGAAGVIDARRVVSGDLLQLAAGDIVAADAELTTTESLQLDESMLTGEAEPVTKVPGEAVFAGTVVTRGRAYATVTATAASTTIGGIARSVQRAAAPPTPVQHQLAVLGRRLAWATAFAAVVVGVLNVSAGRGIETSLVLAVSLAVAAIPESLPAVVALALAMAARRMANRGVLARRMAAVEALGSVTVMATDKTGTLTTGRMTLAATWPAHGADADRLLEAAVLCNDAGTTSGAGTPDDPTEVSLVEGATAAGIDVTAVRSAFPRVAEIPFDATTARMTTVHTAPDGTQLTICKGAPEAVLDDLADAAGAGEQAAAFAEQGYRVLAIARRDGAGAWRLLGLVGLVDPPRPQARQMIDAFRRAGVRPVMITGDHPRTAAAIARRVGIRSADGAPADVHARVRPDGKVAVVAAMQADGDVVAMTGDGVNDAPALRAADVGIAMGRRGTQVARQAADLVLTDDDLSAMVPAIGEGRRAYDNLRRFLHYALGGGVAEVLIMLFGPLLGFPVPLQSGQILWVNLLTHGLPGVAIGSEPAAADVFSRPPRPPREQLLDGRTAGRVAVLGIGIAIVCTLAATYAKLTDRPWQSVLFLSLAACQLAAALALRPQGRHRGRNPLLVAAVAVNVGLALLAVSWRPLRELLRTDPIEPRDLLPCLAAAAVIAVVAWLQIRVASQAGVDHGDRARRGAEDLGEH
jgi:Ca2+-transporting ATPase